MPVYVYECECGHVAEEFSTVDGRESPSPCEQCQSRERTIILFPVSGKMGNGPNRMITNAECDAKYGGDWRETRNRGLGDGERSSGKLTFDGKKP